MAIRSNSAHAQANVLMLVAGLFCLGLPALAAGEAPTQAESLFQSGLEKMRKGEYSSACPDLAASYEIEPLPGALFTLAECEASWGKVATALKHYQQFIGTLSSQPPARRQKFEERRRLALDQIATLSPTVPLISVGVTAGSPSALVVKCGDSIIAESSYGVQTPVDPAELVITAELGGKTVWQRHVRMASHDRASIVVPWPLPEPVAAEAPRGAGAPKSAPTTSGHDDLANHQSHEDASVTTKGGNSLTTWKYLTAGVGVAGFTVSLVAGAIALGKKGSISEECANYRCSQTGLDNANSAKQAARIGTAAFIVGLAGAAGYVGLSVFGKPKREPTRTSSIRMNIDGTPNGGELRVEGSF